MKGKRRVERSYSPEEKAQALRQLALNKGNLSKAVKEAGIPAATLHRWRDEELRESMDPQAREIEKSIKNAWKNILALNNPAFIKKFKDPLLKKGNLREIAYYTSTMLDAIMALIRGQLLTGGSRGSKEKPLGEFSDEELDQLYQEEEAKEKKKKEGG